MKKLIFGCAIAISGFMMPQVSADYCGGPCGPSQDYCCPMQYNNPCCCDGDSFDGFYVGGNLGVFSHVAHRNDLDGFLIDNSGWSAIDTSFTAGVQLGYDWQCCYKLLGIVADWNWVDTDRRIRNNPNSTTTDQFINNEAHWFTTIRARAGLTVCDALVYVTGGAVVARFETKWNENPNTFHHRNTRWGWTGGVGAEFILGCGFSLGAEFLFAHFDEHNKTFRSIAGTNFTFGHSDSFYVGRVLLNYRFGDLFSCCCR